MLKLIKDLCSYSTSVVSDGNIKLFKRIKKEVPLKIKKIKSDTEYNGWIVPKKWEVVTAKIYRNGKLLYDAKNDILGVAYYSNSFTGTLNYTELKEKIVTNPELPNASMFHCEWQYRPWAADFKLVIPYNIFKKFPRKGNFFIDLKTKKTKGEMLIGISEVKGKSNKVIVFNSNNCHPKMANDGFAGTAVLIKLMQYLKKYNNFYTYRLVIAPEHLGSVFYLNKISKKELSRIVCGIFEEMPGTNGKIRATQTFNGEHQIDKAFSNVLNNFYPSHSILSGWRKGAGNDETVWEAPGYEIPFVELTRCEDTFKPFKEYHSSLDNPDLMKIDKLEEILDVLKKTIFILENNFYIERKFNGILCLSNPKYDLYFERPDPTINKNLKFNSELWGVLQDSLLRFFDGKTSILDIAQNFNVPHADLLNYIKKFEAKKLVKLKRAEISR